MTEIDDSDAQDAGGHVPRINQLDAATLDEELLSSFHEQISEAFRYFIRNPLDTIGPELDTLVRCLLWRFTVLDQGGSIGQSLLGIKFSTSSSWRLWILAATDIISNYLSQRQSMVIKNLPGREETKFYIQHKLSILLRFVQILNLVMFLRQGQYPTPSLMVLGIKPVSTIGESRSVGYSFMSRELLWSTFSELLQFLVPLVNVSRLRGFTQSISRYFVAESSAPQTETGSGVWVCCACKARPVVAARSKCGHLFCHVCSIRQRCPVCGLEMTRDKLNYLA